MFPSRRNQRSDLQGKSIDWFLYDKNIGCYELRPQKVLIMKSSMSFNPFLALVHIFKESWV